MKDNLVEKVGRGCRCKQPLNDSIAKSFNGSISQ